MNLAEFIQWAKTIINHAIQAGQVYDTIVWEANSWHAHGISGSAFTALGSTGKKTIEMQAQFVDFVKALVVRRKCFQLRKNVNAILGAARALEAALVELTDGCDATLISAAVCNRACDFLNETYAPKNAYMTSIGLGQVVTLMREKRLLKEDFRWVSPVRRPKRGSLKQQQKDAEKKLPSRESLTALGTIFNNKQTNPLDIVVTSACVLLLSAPSRVGELSDLPHDCVFHKIGADGNERMFLHCYAEKMQKRMHKPVVRGMEPAVERALRLLEPICKEAREYAQWLEDNPNQFPKHDGVPSKESDQPLTYAEVCQALKIEPGRTPRTRFKNDFLKRLNKKRDTLSENACAILDQILQGWDTSKGRRNFSEGRLVSLTFNDTPITLGMLNVLVRDRYLPKHFPYTTPYEDGKERIKFSKALFTVRIGALVSRSAVCKAKDFGVEIAANQSRMAAQLGGRGSAEGIFERHGYGEISVNSHAFRHELNTQMHRAGLSQFLIDAFSGRTSMGSVYNHETIEEKTQRVAQFHPGTKTSNTELLEKITTNEPLKLSDVIELQGDSDRLIHKTHLGLCAHSFAMSPCPKMGACLTCGLLGCVKGDDVKLSNLKREREAINKSHQKAEKAKSEGALGAEIWIKKSAEDLAKCDALIALLESPELEDGSIVWNRDNGWNLTNNAAVMAGLIEVETIEAEKKSTALPSLDELIALNNRFGN